MTEAEWLACEDPQKMLEFLRDKTRDWKIRLFIASCCRRVCHLLPDELLRDAAGRHAVEVAERWADDPEEAGKYTKSFDAVLISARCEYRLYEKPILASTLLRPLPALLVLAVALRPKDSLDGHLWDAVTRSDVLGGEEEADLIRQAQGASKYTADAHAAHAVRQARTERGWIVRLLNLTPPAVRLAGEQQRKTELRRHARLIHCLFGNPFRNTVIDPHWLRWNSATVERMAQAIYDDQAFDHLPILADALEEAGCQDQDILNHCRSECEHVRGCWVVDLLLGQS